MSKQTAKAQSTLLSPTKPCHIVPLLVPSTLFPYLCLPHCSRTCACHIVPVLVPATLFPYLCLPHCSPTCACHIVPLLVPATCSPTCDIDHIFRCRLGLLGPLSFTLPPPQDLSHNNWTKFILTYSAVLPACRYNYKAARLD